LDHLVAPAISVAELEAVQSGELVPLVPALMRQHFFYAAVPAFAKAHPDFLNAFWRASCQASWKRRTGRSVCGP
jgi:hypothetical protein